MSARLQGAIDADAERLVDIFKDIHQNPELGFMEIRTAAIVEKELARLGYDVKTGIGRTGVVGVLENGAGPIVMYRADMDANAVRETTGLPYASTKTVRRTTADGHEEEVPVAHVCGHDAHTTWLIGIAKVMAENMSDWRGTLILVGQPAEELISGAKAMVRDGLYESGVPEPDCLIGLHTMPLPTGLATCNAGPTNAGTDQLDVTFHGIGGHGSSPHLAKDPVLMACSAVVQYQFIVSRGVDPLHAAVLTVGSVQAGNDNNVIPDSALVKINLRWYDPKDRELMLTAIDRINRSIAAAFGLPESSFPTTTVKGGSSVLSNDSELAASIAPALKGVLGEHAVLVEIPKLMGSEDFHHLVLDNEKSRYLFVYVGTAKPEHFQRAQEQGMQVPYSNHNPDYQVDLDAIPLGVKIGAAALLKLMGSPPED
ncbi:MAG: amidohydrolase [Actinomycetia bacterium]|nr:amidohydrolase [Actinomycetes bacterium]MCH9701944.1 amidohydrolase [Actinomycetes bacterium]MCH9759194.1 amidohydrolase [Actinomycetes bacterium]